MAKNNSLFAKPDLEMQGLQIWIHGREFPGDDWLNTTIHCGKQDSEVWVRFTPAIHLIELRRLKEGLERLISNLDESISLNATEPYLEIQFASSSPDNAIANGIEMKVEITPDQMHEKHEYLFSTSKTELESCVSELHDILNRYPFKRSPDNF